MTHYVALIEDAGPEKAVGVVFPDLPGCFSAGDTLDEAITNAPEALALWIEGMIELGNPIPPARSPSQIRADAEIAADIGRFGFSMLLVPAPFASFRPAAE
jgi:predicted RNase H-like HicB family nuclease